MSHNVSRFLFDKSLDFVLSMRPFCIKDLTVGGDLIGFLKKRVQSTSCISSIFGERNYIAYTGNCLKRVGLNDRQKIMIGENDRQN